MTKLTTTRRNVLIGAAAGLAVPIAFPRWALAETTLADIKSSGVLRIGCEATYPPFTFRDAGEIVGYDVDLAAVLCASLGVEPEFIDTQWSGVIPALYAGRFDVIMSSMSYRKERLEKVAFSIPYAEASQALLIRAEDAGAITSVSDLSGKVLGVKLGSPGEMMKPALDEEISLAAGVGFAEVKIYDDHPAAYLALSQGSVDGVLNTLPTLGQVMKDRPGAYALVRPVGQLNWAGIAARKEDPEIVEWLDGELTRLKDKGEIYALQEKWFGFEMQLADEIPSFT
ncbi:transporter substrate-binding domain-containing protein [Roseobacter sp.]|uniref:transporter substrate-binding domain-containing protein n=1 Tax=Roseobacter sp. TaxID=1907202 RepID=UPI00385A45C5